MARTLNLKAHQLAYSSHGEDLGGASDADLIQTVAVTVLAPVCTKHLLLL